MLAQLYNRFRRITSSQLYFPEIDGIRFVAISLVILFHTHGYFAGKTTTFTDSQLHGGALNNLLENGDRGVELFFVLSGFILCLPFARQFIRNDKPVLLKKYYLRRLTRLEPPYIIAMTLIFLLQLATHVKPASVLVPSWLASLIYSHNLIYHHTPLLTVVAWSLEIEIQFYLLAPFIFRILKLPPFTRRTLLLTATVVLVGCQSIYLPPFRSIYFYAQYFFMGILLADFYVSDTASQLFGRRWMALLAFAMLAAICYLPFKNESAGRIWFVGMRLIFPALIATFYYIVLKNETMRRMFSYKFIPVIGGMCYSIYLLHYTIISMFGRYTLNIHFTQYYLPNLLLQICLLGLPVLLISSVFYLYVEQPFMASKWTDMLLNRKKPVAGNKK